MTGTQGERLRDGKGATCGAGEDARGVGRGAVCVGRGAGAEGDIGVFWDDGPVDRCGAFIGFKVGIEDLISGVGAGVVDLVLCGEFTLSATWRRCGGSWRVCFECGGGVGSEWESS